MMELFDKVKIISGAYKNCIGKIVSITEVVHQVALSYSDEKIIIIIPNRSLEKTIEKYVEL